MNDRKYYRFQVYSTNNPVDGWTKVVSISDPKDKEIKSITSSTSKHYPLYQCMMEFKNDKEAIEWFDSHYMGF